MAQQRPERREWFRRPAYDGLEVSLSWIHSVDHTPWTEYYSVRGRQLILERTLLETMGAGTPFSAPRVRRVGHSVELSGFDRPYDELAWIHSVNVKHTLTIGSAPGQEAVTFPPEAFAHHTRLELFVR